MDKNRELNEAIEEVLQEIKESEEFKRRVKRLINNALQETYHDDDILSVIDLMERGD